MTVYSWYFGDAQEKAKMTVYIADCLLFTFWLVVKNNFKRETKRELEERVSRRDASDAINFL